MDSGAPFPAGIAFIASDRGEECGVFYHFLGKAKLHVYLFLFLVQLHRLLAIWAERPDQALCDYNIDRISDQEWLDPHLIQP